MGKQGIRAPRGTADLLPATCSRWVELERGLHELCARYGYAELRTPMFEASELFVRGMGETTDVVEKEMFYLTHGGRSESQEAASMVLRPEFTAGVVRCYVQHGLDRSQGLTKLYSLGSLFRYERPQKGRMREFHQINVEALGTFSPTADFELIHLGAKLLEAANVGPFTLRLNSIGCESCRTTYRKLLVDQLRPVAVTLCAHCQGRLDRNVFRVLDCKRCVEQTAGIPAMAQHLCGDCDQHFVAVCAGLTASGIDYAIDARLVRGFDYYARTVFEYQTERLGAQDALGGGGRYDPLLPTLGAKDKGACGLALGLERMLLAAEGEAQPARGVRPAVFVAATLAAQTRSYAWLAATALRARGLTCELDLEDRSLKAQLRHASKGAFSHAVIVGEDELQRGEVVVRDMVARQEDTVSQELFVEVVADKLAAFGTAGR